MRLILLSFLLLAMSCNTDTKRLIKKKKFKEIYSEFFDREYDKVFISIRGDKSIMLLSLVKTINCIKYAEVEAIKFGPEKFIVFSSDNIRIDSIGFDGDRIIKYKGSTFVLNKKLILSKS